MAAPFTRRLSSTWECVEQPGEPAPLLKRQLMRLIDEVAGGVEVDCPAQTLGRVDDDAPVHLAPAERGGQEPLERGLVLLGQLA